jgi:hypothetical protein
MDGHVSKVPNSEVARDPHPHTYFCILIERESSSKWLKSRDSRYQRINTFEVSVTKTIHEREC